jgi:hypothetical protein
MKGKRNDFPVVSQREPSGPAGDETLFEAAGPRFEKGETTGKVTIGRGAAGQGRHPFTATFTFDDGDEVTLTGEIPGNGSWKGKGTATYGAGTGKFGDRGGQSLPIESDNPKRWG